MTRMLEYDAAHNLYRRLSRAVNSRAKDDCKSKYQVEKIDELRELWEGYNLLFYGNHIVDCLASKEESPQLEKVLSSHGIDGIDAGFRKLPSQKTIGPKKLNSYFLAFAEHQGISTLECFCQFLDFCVTKKLPLTLLDPNFSKSKVPTEEDQENARSYVTEQVEDFRKWENDQAAAQKTDQSTMNEGPESALRSDPKSFPLNLVPPPPAQRDNLNHFSAKFTDISGREKQQTLLRNFLLPDTKGRKFLWCQLAGAAGQGKSRLALDLIEKASQDDQWVAGFLNNYELEDMYDQWKQWQPNKPHLIVLDYVIGRNADHLKKCLATLARRRMEFCHNVRVLLVERQPWNQGIKQPESAPHQSLSKMMVSNSRAAWFTPLTEGSDGYETNLSLSQFLSGVIELDILKSPVLVKIVRQVAEKIPGNKVDWDNDSLDDMIQKRLERMGKDDGRPLYAYFLAQALAEGINTENWTRIDLLNDALTRERRRWWRPVLGETLPDYGEDTPAMRLSVLATMTGEFDCEKANAQKLFSQVHPKDRKQAQCLTGSPISDAMGKVSQTISGMQPDLLGEWHVITCFNEGLPIAELSEIAWKIDPLGMSSFIQRICQDFDSNRVTTELLDNVNVNVLSPEILSTFANALLSHYLKHPNIPQKVIEALEIAANLGNPAAKSSLGQCYEHGLGVGRDESRAVALYREAAKLNEPKAMVYLATCYMMGKGTDPAKHQALELIQKAVKLGSPYAMVSLGISYHHGVGVEKDAVRAAALYQQAADLHHPDAMVHLAQCYKYGLGVSQDERRVAALYRQAADMKMATAMAHLGKCYESGFGVTPDMPRAVSLYQQAVDLNNWRGMIYLADCYKIGLGVEQDEQRAIALMERAYPMIPYGKL